MKKIALAFSLALSTLAAPALAQSTTDTLLTGNLTSLARVMGDRYGHLVMTDAAGATKILAYGTSRFIVYTAGDGISTTDDLAFCVEDASGGLSQCTGPETSVPDLECTTFPDGKGKDGWCQCTSLRGCFSMIVNHCKAPIDCYGGACYCTNT